MVSPPLLPGPSKFPPVGPDYVVTQDHRLPAGPPNPQGHFVPSGCPGPSSTSGPGHGRPHSRVLQVGSQMTLWEPGGAWWGPTQRSQGGNPRAQQQQRVQTAGWHHRGAVPSVCNGLACGPRSRGPCQRPPGNTGSCPSPAPCARTFIKTLN